MVSTTMPMLALFLRRARVASRPLPSGSRRAMGTTSGCRAPAWRTASAAGGGLANGLGGGGGLADDLELPVAFECVSQPLTDQVVIVNKEDLGARRRRRTGRHARVTPLLERKRYPARYRAGPKFLALRQRLSRWGVAE